MSDELLDADLLANLRAERLLYPDVVRLLLYETGASDPLGNPTEEWVEQSLDIPARFRPLEPDELADAAQLQQGVGRLHLALGYIGSVDGLDRVRIYRRWDTAAPAPRDFELLGSPVVNALELVVNCRLVTNGKQ